MVLVYLRNMAIKNLSFHISVWKPMRKDLSEEFPRNRSLTHIRSETQSVLTPQPIRQALQRRCCPIRNRCNLSHKMDATLRQTRHSAFLVSEESAVREVRSKE